jgi:hypothetical protein
MITGCQICNGNPCSHFDIPGIGTAILCFEHRRIWQALLLRTYPGLTAEFQVASAQFRRMMSGWPSATGMTDDATVASTYLDLEEQMLTVWEEFVADQAAEHATGSRGKQP